MTPQLAVIIVSYNTRDLLLECLASVMNASQTVPVEVIVVDNASSDSTAVAVRATYPNVRLIQAGANLGFAAANNRGLSVTTAPFVLFLNPDTIVAADSFASALHRMSADPSIGVLGCRIVHPDGRVQPSARTLPNLLSLAVETFGLAKLLPHGPAWGDPWVTDDRREQPVGVVKGAFMLTRREVLERIGGFDERFFLYSEEQDWCHRAVEAGWTVLYFPGTTIIHREGSSSPVRRASSRFIIYDSETAYFQKHFGPLTALLARVLMVSGVTLRAVAWTMLSGFGVHRRRWSTARVYWLALLWFIERTIGTVPSTLR